MNSRAKTRIGVLGASGRMGRAVIELIDTEYRDRCTLSAAISSRDGNFGDLADVNVVIDFSLPEGTAQLCDWLSARDGATPMLVCGTTGLSSTAVGALQELGRTRCVLHASNFSAGVAALESILEFAAPMLETLGYTPVLTEAHHSGKKDAPSGTAKSLQQVIQPDSPETVQTHSLRAGAVIGEHEVRFFGPDDELVIRHSALTRRLFARGALDAALWLATSPEASGFMTMRDYFRARFETDQT